MNFFIKTSKGVFGPFTKEQISLNVKQGKIKSHHLISISKTGDFQKITKEFLSGDHGSLSSRSESPPELGSGNSFDNPTSIQLSKPKKLRNSRKPKSRRELLEDSSIASTPVHAVSHFSSEGARYDSLSKVIKEGNEKSSNQWAGAAMFIAVFLIIAIPLSIFSYSVDRNKIGSFTTKGQIDKLIREQQYASERRKEEINFEIYRLIHTMLPAEREQYIIGKYRKYSNRQYNRDF